ncbi:hypothetical protein HG531_002045 [Fusarium graminearum]|nr:hypothetical protein HG531_002045 [Fusarium graminearum]
MGLRLGMSWNGNGSVSLKSHCLQLGSGNINWCPPRVDAGRILVHGPSKVWLSLLQETLHSFLGVFARKQIPKDLALEKVRLLGRRCAPVDHVFHHTCGNTAYISRDLIGDLERRRQDLVWGNDLAEESVEKPVRGWVDAARCGEMKSAAGPYQAREEEAAARLHTETTATKHKANLGIAAHNADVGTQSHGYAHANSRAVYGNDDGFVATVHGQGNDAARVSMVSGVFTKCVLLVEVHARAVHAVLWI